MSDAAASVIEMRQAFAAFVLPGSRRERRYSDVTGDYCGNGQQVAELEDDQLG
jgi:hypothetical protein